MDEERNPSMVWCYMPRQATASKKSIKQRMHNIIGRLLRSRLTRLGLHHTFAGLRSLPRSMWCYNFSIPSGFRCEIIASDFVSPQEWNDICAELSGINTLRLRASA